MWKTRTVDVHIRRLRKALEPAGMTAWCRPCAVQDIVFQPAFNALLIGRRAGLMIS
ncbi:phosphate regulon transcriptional regulatory protein PhoB [Escherichia coli]|nr:phosphate regulon transcriptional regulatory protein PhoB [Escherichia coli]